MTDPTPAPGFYDAELRRHDVHFREATAIRRDDHVLDVGCGTGQTTRDAGRSAVGGSAAGVDTSAAALEHARRMTEAEGLGNVTYEWGDAETHPFAAARYDVGISRFGAMFFTDPVAAFTNIGRALRRGARLVLLVWQASERNEWFTAPREALRGPDAPPPTASALEPFSLADPATTERTLTTAGFVDIGFTAVREPAWYGADPEAACTALLRLRHVRELLTDLDAPTADQARRRLHAVVEAHDTGDGVLLDSSAWIVTARRR